MQKKRDEFWDTQPHYGGDRGMHATLLCNIQVLCHSYIVCSSVLLFKAILYAATRVHAPRLCCRT